MSSANAASLPMYDITARKAHQWTMVALLVVGFVLGAPASSFLVGLAGAIMLLGRFWWPADVVRQLVWRVLEPAGILRRNEVNEDCETRRIARVMGGVLWLGSAVLIATPLAVVGWILTALIGIMVVLDASMSFCALCFIVSQLERRHLLPAQMVPNHSRHIAGEA